MKKFALAIGFVLWSSAAFAQCTGIFQPNTVCGNLTGSPQPPAAFSTAGLIIGPVSSTLNGLPIWANTAGTQLKDGAGQTIAGNYTWGGTQTFSALANFTSTFQISGNAMTFPGVAATLASWGAGNTWSGSQAGTFNITGTFQIGGATVALPISAPNGGTGVASPTAHTIPINEGASAQANTGVGVAGQPLISNGAGADPTFQTLAVIQAAPGNPTGTSSASFVMMGLGATCKITPITSGRVKFVIVTVTANTTSGTTNVTSFRFGTSAAPANGVAATGTAPGSSKSVAIAVTSGTATITHDYIVTGLVSGTAYWFDLALSTGAGAATISNIDCNAMEF